MMSTENENTNVDNAQVVETHGDKPMPVESVSKPSSGGGEVPAQLADPDPVKTFGNPNVELTREFTAPLKKPIVDEYVAVISSTLQEFNNTVEQLPNLDYTRSQAGKQWLQDVIAASALLLRGGALMSTTEREGTLWKQTVNCEGSEVSAGAPQIGEAKRGEIIEGEKALLRVNAMLGLGSLIQTPLWHSGLWITFKAPSESSLLELDRRIAAEKVTLGRATNGLIFSNHSIYITYHVVNFALAHMYECSMKDVTPERLKEVILATDIPSLVWGLILTIYPNGYPMKQPCIKNPDSCQHVFEAMLNVAKLSWTDNHALSPAQKKHMVNRKARHTLEALKEYQDAHDYQNRLGVVEVSPGVRMKLRVPTIAQHEASGFAWVDGIVKAADEAMGIDLRGQERDQYIQDQGRLTVLRQFGHWVDKIIVGEDAIIEDRQTIEETLGSMTRNEEYSDIITNAIGKYIDGTTISFIAIPKHSCPKCGTEQETVASKHPRLIPLDVMQLFFIQAVQSTSRALSRA